MKQILIAVLISFLSWTNGFAQSDNEGEGLNQEIIRYAVNPCFRHQAHSSGFSESMGEEEALELLKIHNEDFVKAMIRVVALNVLDVNKLENRKYFYRRSADNCIKAFEIGKEAERKEQIMLDVVGLE